MKQRLFNLVSFSLILLVAISFFLLFHTPTVHYTPQIEKITDYDSASKELAEVSALDTDDIDPICKTQFLTHGKKTEKVIVLLHGYTNCPEQFSTLGKSLYLKGYNIVIPRIPHHGLKDKMTSDLSNFRAEEALAFTDNIINLSSGLGEEITVVGLSGQGILTAWVAQNSEIEKAVIIAPNFAPPYPLTHKNPITNLSLLLPNRFYWWNEVEKENVSGPKYSYPRFSSRAVGEYLRIGNSVVFDARVKKPKAEKITIITLEDDPALNNSLTYQLADDWKQKKVNLTFYEFSKDLNLNHDIIDKNQPTARVDIVYPKLIELIEN